MPGNASGKNGEQKYRLLNNINGVLKRAAPNHAENCHLRMRSKQLKNVLINLFFFQVKYDNNCFSWRSGPVPWLLQSVDHSSTTS